MFYIEGIDGDSISIGDDTDGTVEQYTKTQFENFPRSIKSKTLGYSNGTFTEITITDLIAYYTNSTVITRLKARGVDMSNFGNFMAFGYTYKNGSELYEIWDDVVDKVYAIPDGTTKIIEGFQGSRRFKEIEEVTIPGSMLRVTDHLFKRGKLRRVVMNDGVRAIGSGTFYECTDLSEVIFPNSLYSIGSYAFYRANIERCVIPESVGEIGSHAFESYWDICDQQSYESVSDSGIPSVVCSFRNLKRIGELAFGGVRLFDASSGTEVSCLTITKTMELSYGAFLACYVETVKVEEGVTKLPADAFEYAGVRDMFLPESINTIYSGDCIAIRNLVNIYCIRNSNADKLVRQFRKDLNKDVKILYLRNKKQR